MDVQARPSTSFENHSHGVQNANTGGGRQNNNNSTGTQYNISGNAWISASGDVNANNQLRVEQAGDNEILQSLAFPEMLNRRSDIEQRHENTCQWILELEQYRTWRSQSYGLLWIKGKPGAGKSTLMVFLHDELGESHREGQGIRLDFFFTARGTEMQRTPLGMLRSLSNQIFVQDESVRPKVREIYARKCGQFGYGDRKWEWQRRELEELLADAVLLSAKRQQVTVFVDALDEAGTESAQQLAEYFHRVNARTTQANAAVKICISCRHYPVVSTVPGIEVVVEDHNREDIAAYINDKLRLECLEAEGSREQEAWTGLKNELIEQANGVFQWAHVVTPLIEQMAQDGKSPQDVRDWLRQVPPKIEGVYEYIFNRVIKPDERVQSFLLFQWICLAERPLTVTEMRYAMAARDARVVPYQRRCHETDGFVKTDERMRRRIKALSGGLAEVIGKPSGDGTVLSVQVVHQSVNDFLQAKGLGLLADLAGASKSTVPDPSEVISQCQATLYRSCLVYLATEDVSQKILNDPHADDDQNEKRLLIQSPFMGYATINLFVHAEKARRHRSNGMEQEITLLQKCVGKWVLIYRVLGRRNDGCPAAGTSLLHMASAANLTDLVEHLASAGDDICKRDDDGNTAFHAAAQGGHVDVGEILYEKGADYDARSYDRRTPLLEAAAHGRVEFVEWLLNKGARIDEPTGRFGNALQAASSEGKQEVVEILLAAGADVNAQGGHNGNALQAASFYGNREVVQMLLAAGADVNAQGGYYGNALQAASFYGNREVVQMLLAAGADVNAQGGKYGNALQATLLYGNSEVAQILLAAGADVNAQGGYYGNALQAASLQGNREVVQMLLAVGADVNAQGGKYGNALQATLFYGNSEVAQILLAAGADVNSQGGYYGNALQAASFYGNREVVQMLLVAGADVNAQSGYYGNALQAASFHENREVVQMLLAAGADVNAQGGYYGNALQAASLQGNREVVQMLLAAGADVNAQGGRYGNALLAALSYSHLEVIQILLEAGANPSLTIFLDSTPLHIAASNGNLDLLKQFPVFSVSVLAQNKFRQTPLHLALERGKVDFAIALLKQGSDPRHLDCFGQNAMDLALGRDILVDQMRQVCPAIALTPKEIQVRVLRQSVHDLSAMLLRSRALESPIIIHKLGRCLLFLDDLHRARSIFRLLLHIIECDACDELIHDSLFICRACQDKQFCSVCVQDKYYHSKLYPGQKHEFLEVSDLPQGRQTITERTQYEFDWENSLALLHKTALELLPEHTTDLLKSLMNQYSEPKTQTTEGRIMNRSPTAKVKVEIPSSTAPENAVKASRIINGPGIPVSLAVIGLLVVLLLSWYYHLC